MKRILYIAAVCGALLATASSCKKAEPAKEDPVKVTLEVTDIADNCATVRASLESGKFYGAKIIDMMNRDDLAVDLANEIQLVRFIEENGAEITLPYEKKLEKVKIGIERFSAVIAYDSKGIAKSVAYVVWSPEGNPEGWSTDNGAGSLGENEWK